MKIEGNYAIFETGKRVYANRGIIGLSPDLNVTEGYDGGFFNHEDYFADDEDRLTPLERIELADHMILQWQKFRHAASEKIRG